LLSFDEKRVLSIFVFKNDDFNVLNDFNVSVVFNVIILKNNVLKRIFKFVVGTLGTTMMHATWTAFMQWP